VAEARKALDLDPVNPDRIWQLGFCLYFDRRFDESIARCKEALDLNPALPYMHFILGWNYAQKRMYPEACAEAHKALEALPEDQVALGGCGSVYGLAGRRDDAQRCLDRLRKLSKQTHVDPFNFAWVLDGLGNNDSTMVWLERSYQERSAVTTMLRTAIWWTDRLRADPRYQALVRRMNFPPLPKL
jgi:tetratricopeptide (TPR) repeat protein